MNIPIGCVLINGRRNTTSRAALPTATHKNCRLLYSVQGRVKKKHPVQRSKFMPLKLEIKNYPFMSRATRYSIIERRW
jgi:hypothetical protein